MKTIEVEIGPDGKVKIEAVGFTGTACKAATRAYEDALIALGGRVEAVVAKAEMKANAATNAKAIERLKEK